MENKLLSNNICALAHMCKTMALQLHRFTSVNSDGMGPFERKKVDKVIAEKKKLHFRERLMRKLQFHI